MGTLLSNPIKDWSKDDQPREKLMKKGIASLSNAELLAIILRSGSADDNAVELSRKIMAQVNNNLNELAKLDIADLKKHKGIGLTKAVTIIAALEIGRRRDSDPVIKKKQVITSKDAIAMFHPLLCDLPHEEFWVVFLNRSNHFIEKYCLSKGGVSEVIIDVRLVMKLAINHLASSFILCHNHPSGNCQPSLQDESITKQIKDAGELLNIKLLDHLIVGSNQYYSFSENFKV